MPDKPTPLTRHLRASDLRAAAQLLTQATRGVATIVEGVHRSVLDAVGLPGGTQPGQTRGLTGLVYRSVHGVTHWVGAGVDAALRQLQPLLEPALPEAPGSHQREAVLAALNGVIGDRLAASGNPLAIPMALWHAGQALDLSTPLRLPEARPRVLLMLHGLCRNDLQWNTEHDGQPVNHGDTLARALDHTPLYLRYNTGLPITQNGRLLALQLEQLCQRWPVPLQTLSVLAHSMGGLVMRAAVHHAQTTGLQWPAKLRHIVFLGTPHLGAPLERAGHGVDRLLDTMPYTAPLARLGRLRSAGITDLRHGLDTPLPPDVACLAVAATTATRRSLLADRLVGDGLVPLRSALGQHDDPARCLDFGPGNRLVVYRTHHMALLSDPAVGQQVLAWLARWPDR